ncbi:MAG: DksA/TraR family C4-type zinc finger protein [Desulforhopalus sp.]
MAGGWTSDGAVQEQIDASVKDAVKLARSRIPKGKGLSNCEECDEPIPAARKEAIPGVHLCILCQSEKEKHQTFATGFNRRGSKDSQLK